MEASFLSKFFFLSKQIAEAPSFTHSFIHSFNTYHGLGIHVGFKDKHAASNLRELTVWYSERKWKTGNLQWRF